MNIKNIIITVLIIIIIAIAAWTLTSKTQAPTVLDDQTGSQNEQVPVTSTTTNQTEQATTSTPAATSVIKTYSLTDISKHNTASDCWTTVSGKVYNVTEFIPNHPGGKEILKACGKDATRLFSSQEEHVEQNAQATLDLYFIGNLK